MGNIAGEVNVTSSEKWWASSGFPFLTRMFCMDNIIPLKSDNAKSLFDVLTSLIVYNMVTVQL